MNTKTENAIQLRPYQQAAITAIHKSLRERDDNPCAVLPTGAGKGVIIGKLCADLAGAQNMRVLVLVHVRELVAQNHAQVCRFLPHEMVGVNCNGLGRRDRGQPVIVASIKSVYQYAADLGAFDMAIIDEAHMIGESEDFMYKKLFAGLKALMPAMRIIGLTATPYRMASGIICGPNHILNHICYQVGVGELIRQGYLSRLVTKSGSHQPDTSKLKLRAGEFVAEEVDRLMGDQLLVEAACAEIVQYTRERQSVLVFAANVAHGQHLAQVLSKLSGEPVYALFSSTAISIRDRVLREFAQGRHKYLVNVSVLATGYDNPRVDCVAIVRPTMSPILYYQITGRGLRIHPGKQDCLILDYGGNIERHGAIDDLNFGIVGQPIKTSALCHKCNQTAETCLCGELERTTQNRLQVKHETTASSQDILKNVQTGERVYKISYYRMHNNNFYPRQPPALKIVYELGYRRKISEWISFEGQDAEARKWWKTRSELPVPRNMMEAWKLAMKGALREPGRVIVQKGQHSGWLRIENHDFSCEPVQSNYKAFSCISFSPEVFKR